MNCRIESERFFDWQGAKDKIAAGVAKATSRTISGLTTQFRRKKSRSNAKALLLETQELIKPKTKITMNANSTKSKLRPRRFLNNYHSSIINYQLIARPRRSFFSLLTSNFSLFTLFSLPHLCTYKLILPNKPNFQTTGQTITLVMRKNYNEKKLLPTKKNKPKTHQKRTKIEKKRIKTSKYPYRQVFCCNSF